RTEDTGVAQNSIVRSTARIRGRRFRIAGPVDDTNGRRGAPGICRCQGIAVRPIVVIPEDAALCARCQHNRIESLASSNPLLVVQNEEVRLVADNRAAKISGSLLEVSPWPGHGLPRKWIDGAVVFPNVGVENRVFGTPHTAAMKLVRSGPRLNLNLAA